MRQQTLFDSSRLSFDESIELTAQSLNSYLSDYRHVAIAYSGGKDSSTVVSLFAWLIEQGRVELPKGCQVHVLYADTRQELPPLHFAAMAMLDECRGRGFKAQVVCAKMAHRFWPYILGRGVPSPNNGTLRWCTSKIKVEPMTLALEDLRRSIGLHEKLLMLTGVRMGESAARDNRIAVSCTKDGGECGQGWFQRMTVKPKEDLSAIDTLAPILHWRVCHVWDWLVQADVEYGFPTMQVAEAYSMTESIEAGDEPIASRTGCSVLTTHQGTANAA
ncbi:MAG: phosphoadenosine phosphosulfate reductase family protein, partial [Cyanobacteria bacterium P01_F01_bin.3]